MQYHNSSKNSRHSPSWKLWDPEMITNETSSIALMVLNQPLIIEAQNYIKNRWKSFALRIAVDGGLKHLDGLSEKLLEDRFVPDIISGDFDSVSQEMLDKYAALGSKVIHTPDQNETDFTKALKICFNVLSTEEKKVDCVLVLGKNESRMDHFFGNFNSLYHAAELSPIPVVLFSNKTLSWLIESGRHKIVVSKEILDSHVGLIPLGEPCENITTTGLVWNLSQGSMKFGGLISICNRFDGSEFVTIENDQTILWTMEFNLS